MNKIFRSFALCAPVRNGHNNVQWYCKLKTVTPSTYFEILEVGRDEEIVAIVAAVTEFSLSALEIRFEIHWQGYGTSYNLFFGGIHVWKYVLEPAGSLSLGRINV